MQTVTLSNHKEKREFKTKPEKSLRQKLLAITSLAVLAMATTSVTAPIAQAQNDVDGYDGLVYSGCPNGAITAGETARRQNMVAGMRHCISTGADRNIISGGYHNIGANSDINTISGWRHTIGQTSLANLVNGNRNQLGDSSWHNTLSGYQIIAAGNGNFGNALLGDTITMGGSSSYNSVTGSRQTLGSGTRGNDMSGRFNSMGDLVRYNSMTGRRNMIGNAEAGNQDVTGTANHISGAFNGVGVIRTAGTDGILGTQDDILSAPVGFFTGAGNDVSGRYNTLGASSSNNRVSGRNHNVGNYSSGNSVAGYGQDIGNLSNYNHVSGGFFNRMDNNTNQVSILGSNNYTGAHTENVQIMGRGNDLCNDTDTGPGFACSAGGTSDTDRLNAVNILGSDNKVFTQGVAGSHVKILGDGNSVNGVGSGWNIITAHNSTVEGSGNFVAGGNETQTLSVTGSDNVAIGGGMTATGNNTVAIGNNGSAIADNAIAIGSCFDFDSSGTIDPASECTQANDLRSTAIGTAAQAGGVQSTAIGATASANGGSAIAIGTNASADGLWSVSMGTSATAQGQKSIALGLSSSSAGGNTVAIGTQSVANGANAVAIGRGANATGINALAMGLNSTANGTSAFALGPDANAAGLRSLALGNNAQALETSSTAVGRDANASHSGSSAFGFGATTSLANQMMFGTASVTYVMPGITSFASKNRQSGAVYYVTSDANGNLAVTDDPVPVADASATPSSDGAKQTGTPTTGGHTVGGHNVETTDERFGGNISEAPVDSRNGLVDSSLVGSNLNFGNEPVSTPVPGNGQTSLSLMSQNASAIAVNAEAIEVNRQDIQKNAILIDQAFSQISENTDLINANAVAINDLGNSLAAVAAVPDMYLSPGAKWSASGGFSTVSDQIGFGATLSIRGSENWAVGASVGMGGSETATKVQFRWEEF